MLYDPKWEKTDRVFQGVSLRAFAEWLEKQPADKTYSYITPHECAIAQYLQSTGVSWSESSIKLPIDPDADGFWLEEIVNNPDMDFTFGGAHRRARAALARVID